MFAKFIEGKLYACDNMYVYIPVCSQRASRWFSKTEKEYHKEPYIYKTTLLTYITLWHGLIITSTIAFCVFIIEWVQAHVIIAEWLICWV